MADNDGITVLEHNFIGNTKGIYCDGVVVLNKNCSTAEKCCTLAEELGHHHTASANIIELDTMGKIKQEQLGHRWGIETLLPLSYFIDAIIDGCCSLAELAEYLEITPEYLQEALNYYCKKYGVEFDYNGFNIILDAASIVVYPAIDDAT